MNNFLYNIIIMSREARDSYYSNCPARNGIDRGLSNYEPHWVVDEKIKYNNDIIRDDTYRLFLQTNANKIMDDEWLKMRKNSSCWNNPCVHIYPTRMNPKLFSEERKRANMVFTERTLPESFRCQNYADARMTKTPLSEYKISNLTCNGNC